MLPRISKTIIFHLPNHNFPFHFLMIFIFFLLIIPFSAYSLTFNFTSFDTNDKNITYEYAYPAGKVIQLVPNQRDENATSRAGRATYYQSMQLWDKTTRNLTDFTTHFSFVIDSRGSSSYGDGMAFFLVPPYSKIPNGNYTKGWGLGLTSDGQPLNSTSNAFVAVEFDIFSNYQFDPPNEHVGIDVNSVKSVSNLTWWANITAGKLNEAWISYNSSTHNLSVVFTGYRNNIVKLQHLFAIIDLRNYLPERVDFGFSAATGDAFVILSVRSWDFSSTLEVIDNLTDTQNPVAGAPIPPVPNMAPNKRRKNMVGRQVGLGVGGIVLAGGLVLICCSLWKKWNKTDEDDDHGFDEPLDDDFERETGPKKYTYAELALATKNFKDEEKLGQGGFGSVYRGVLRDSNSYIAVKRVAKGSKQGIKEYASEVRIISRLRHRNLVQLLGWCHERKELLLVYEYLPNGSLDFHLFEEHILLTWERRYKISQDLASALLYLHEEWEQCVLHRDIKASNIMLDSSFNAKLGDFGLARLVDHAKGSQTTVLAGTMGYMAPECTTTYRSSKESDVYSFGVVALEVACGRKPVNPWAAENQLVMVEWVWELHGSGKILEAADPRLSKDFDEQQMKCLMLLGLWCTHPDPSFRPSMRKAIQVLNFEAPLPELPSSLPIPTYLTRQAKSPTSSFGSNALEGNQNQDSSCSHNTNSS
ncbi:Receptor lectin kinase [Quillaja saponaria]|uniref:Receptor lectin kinase n=1 Tax=Quillaja saponaria TaxID=32244 RepID=A0AAD7KX90_QUISA|nr:Receptor lectin kinase [Quillaja saponaria]